MDEPPPARPLIRRLALACLPSALLRLQRSVHPAEPALPPGSFYLQLSPRKRYRLLASKPARRPSHSPGRRASAEYWFTRCDRPLRPAADRASDAKIAAFVERLVNAAMVDAVADLAGRRGRKGRVNLGFVGEEQQQQPPPPQQADGGKQASKPIVLLLHGIGSSAEVWEPIVKYLNEEGYETVAPDLLGHGHSSVPDKADLYRFRNLFEDVLTLFDNVVSQGGARKCVVAGHSFGCSLASALARYRPQNVVQLILISGGGPTPLAPPVNGKESSWEGCAQALIRPFLFCGLKRAMFYPARGKHFQTCDKGLSVPRHVLKHIAEGQNWPEGDAAFHRRILIPTLLVHGLQDEAVTLVQQCEMERTIPRSFLEVIGHAGHMVMLDAPDQLGQMMVSFIGWWSR